ncbi:MAG: hypothetical protein N5P05_002576 [Chroococcopsis gigantea SAG 12.99]|jgi:hypothetical protein|nr:nitrate reductase associated protein [Chlorogloea purpurea SAG 13.99]MDV3000970.1 hypothetical protein [Chroococcopsis gigantea SAG 12.99]
MSDFFAFEADFVQSLRCIPMGVRLKLDTCGVKLKLQHWNLLTADERQNLVSRPCRGEEEVRDYRDYLQGLIQVKTGTKAAELAIDPHPPWLDPTIIPASVQEKAAEFSVNLTWEQWQSLTPGQRFALIKLSRSSHENLNFYPALREFNLA